MSESVLFQFSNMGDIDSFFSFSPCDACGPECLVLLSCVSCGCHTCFIQQCVECGEAICPKCYGDQLCCAVQESKKKGSTFSFVKQFFDSSKIVHCEDFHALEGLKSLAEDFGYFDYMLPLVNEVALRSVENYIEKGDEVVVDATVIFAENFPRLSQYQTDVKRFNYFKALQTISMEKSYLFFNILSLSEDREQILDGMADFFKDFELPLCDLAKHSMRSGKGKELFLSLKKRGWLNFETSGRDVEDLNHVEALKWIETNGVDVMSSDEEFQKFVDPDCVEIMEYLMREKEMSVKWMESQRDFEFQQDMLEMIFREKGIEAISSIDLDKIPFSFETVAFLKSKNYEFGEKKTLLQERLEFDLAALIAFRVLEYKELSLEAQESVKHYLRTRDVILFDNLVPLIRPLRQKKILTVFLSLRKAVGQNLPKQIIKKILNYCYADPRLLEQHLLLKYC